MPGFTWSPRVVMFIFNWQSTRYPGDASNFHKPIIILPRIQFRSSSQHLFPLAGFHACFNLTFIFVPLKISVRRSCILATYIVAYFQFINFLNRIFIIDTWIVHTLRFLLSWRKISKFAWFWVPSSNFKSKLDVSSFWHPYHVAWNKFHFIETSSLYCCLLKEPTLLFFRKVTRSAFSRLL